MDKFYEYSDNKEECKYKLAVVSSCRNCLFETLCRLEQNKTKKL
jgi:hypothetical protein